MTDHQLAACVEDCLLRLDRGEDLPQVLAAYPHCQDRLRSTLLIAMASRAFPVPVPGATVQRQGKNRLLAEMEQLRVEGAFRVKTSIPLGTQILGFLAGYLRAKGWNRLALSYRMAVAAVLVLLSGGFLTISASASSQPGDMLYSFRKTLSQALPAGLQPVLPVDYGFIDHYPGKGGDLECEAELVLSELASGVNNRAIWAISGMPGLAQEADPKGSNSSSTIFQPDPSPAEEVMIEIPDPQKGFPGDQELISGSAAENEDNNRITNAEENQEKEKEQNSNSAQDQGKKEGRDKVKDKQAKDQEKQQAEQLKEKQKQEQQDKVKEEKVKEE
jgi:hypothetical protein